jgi:hypothetical protein
MTETAPVADALLFEFHAPAVPDLSGLAPIENIRRIPAPLSVNHVPVVSPGMVTVFCSHVSAAEMVYENGYERLLSPLRSDPPNIPVKLDRTQKDTVTGTASAVPQAKSEQFNPSIA